MSEEKKKRVKKINNMKLSEIEAALDNCRKTQGGLNSAYAQDLMSRKEELVHKDARG